MKEFAFKINGAEYKCAVEEIEAGKTKVTVNGKVYEVETEAPKAAPVAAKPAAAPAPKPAAPKPTPKISANFGFDLSEIEKMAKAIEADASKNKGTPIDDGYDGNVDAKSIKLSDMM